MQGRRAGFRPVGQTIRPIRRALRAPPFGQRYEKSGAKTNKIRFCRDEASKAKPKIRKFREKHPKIRPENPRHMWLFGK
ncbi:MAG TPA: hypothetical protein DCW71_00385 [Alistipes sp.]|nr:hypothetical protein [Alistipes sp.]